jgi:uncharacterized RDD family membrane protein YckC
MMYESIILFGIVFTAGYLFGTLTQQRSGLTHHNALMCVIVLVVALYFVWFWTHGGQTLPMKTWHLRIVDRALQPLSIRRALLRYALAWLWFIPPLALHPLLGWNIPHTLLALGVWVILWAGAQRLDRNRQFLHDRLAGTRLITSAPTAR